LGTYVMASQIEAAQCMAVKGQHTHTMLTSRADPSWFAGLNRVAYGHRELGRTETGLQLAICGVCKLFRKML